MSQKSGLVDQQTKKSKKAQKIAKQQQKQKQLALKGQEKKQFKQLIGIRKVTVQEIENMKYIQIKNKKVQEYVDQILSLQHIHLYGVQKNIPKTISVVEAIKHKIGVYSMGTKFQQETEIAKDDNNSSIILIRLKKA